MSEQAVNINTLIELLNKYDVEVPIVQRDYAQGRQDTHTQLVRSNLLSDIKSAILQETPPLDLNFVYGKVEVDKFGEKFIPIDGQQRLTTLFLLHLYAFPNDNAMTKLLSKFTYETRTSSRKFLEKLILNRASVFSSELLPSKEIEDSEWFVEGWKYDPTIQSVFVMLDDIKRAFADIDNLAAQLSSDDFQPIVFKFLEMKELGMEDSLYIKLNARGKPLTPFENFKARLIGRLQRLKLPFCNDFEHRFDGRWTDLFWEKNKESFDQTYLMFFGVLFMNEGLCQSDNNWANAFDFGKINTKLFETIYYTLDYLCASPDENNVLQIIFNALSDKRNYRDRILFHAISSYMYLSKGVDTGSLRQWLRIIRNLTMNSEIDKMELYRSVIDGVNKFSTNWDSLLNYFSENGNVTGFSSEQAKEEKIKAKIIIEDSSFAEAIYQAELHPYFNGQIRSALYYAVNESTNDMDVFLQYWNKISVLFDATKAKYGHLMRRALLTFGDYTLLVSGYKTLCVDDPNESYSTPSMKRLFSNNNPVTKKMLDSLDGDDDIKCQLEKFIENSVVPQTDWRYCFIKYPELFKLMSLSHLRLRNVSEVLIVPNKSSNGYNYEIYLAALKVALEQQGIRSEHFGYLGTWTTRSLHSGGYVINFSNGKYIVKDSEENEVFVSSTTTPIDELIEAKIL